VGATQERPGPVPNGVNEILRYESSLRAFARLARRDTHIAGVPIPASSRVLVTYASNPDTFDIRRDGGRHLGFGNGAHACAGQALARLETAARLRALIDRLDRIHVSGRPTWDVDNVIRRH
jgi:cytochrome P450